MDVLGGMLEAVGNDVRLKRICPVKQDGPNPNHAQRNKMQQM